VDPDDGDTRRRSALVGGGDSLDVRGQTVLVNAHDRSTGVLGRAQVYGFDGTSLQIPVAGAATFAR